MSSADEALALSAAAVSTTIFVGVALGSILIRSGTSESGRWRQLTALDVSLISVAAACWAFVVSVAIYSLANSEPLGAGDRKALLVAGVLLALVLLTYGLGMRVRALLAERELTLLLVAVSACLFIVVLLPRAILIATPQDAWWVLLAFVAMTFGFGQVAIRRDRLRSRRELAERLRSLPSTTPPHLWNFAVPDGEVRLWAWRKKGELGLEPEELLRLRDATSTSSRPRVGTRSFALRVDVPVLGAMRVDIPVLGERARIEIANVATRQVVTVDASRRDMGLLVPRCFAAPRPEPADKRRGEAKAGSGRTPRSTVDTKHPLLGGLPL